MNDLDPKAAVRSFILERFLFSTDPTDLQDAASLTGEGILDSMGALELITFLEATFSVHILDDEIMPGNFDSVERIADFVLRKKPADVGLSVA